MREINDNQTLIFSDLKDKIDSHSLSLVTESVAVNKIELERIKR